MKQKFEHEDTEWSIVKIFEIKYEVSKFDIVVDVGDLDHKFRITQFLLIVITYPN